MLSCRTNDEMLVCLKYCLFQLDDEHIFDFQPDLREHLGEVCWRWHDKAFIVVWPRNQVLYAGIFQHAETLISRTKPRTICQKKNTYLYNLWMKAVCTTFGCCDDVAAAALSPLVMDPFWCAESTYVPLVIPPEWSISGLLWIGGPIATDAGGVISMGSPWLGSIGFVDDGRIGMFRCVPLCWGSPRNGLRAIDWVTGRSKHEVVLGAIIVMRPMAAVDCFCALNRLQGTRLDNTRLIGSMQPSTHDELLFSPYAPPKRNEKIQNQVPPRAWSCRSLLFNRWRWSWDDVGSTRVNRDSFRGRKQGAIY